MNQQNKKVFVGLSGGVDSSVSAALLKKAGYDVTGVFIKVWSPDFLNCTWKDDRLDAMRVAAHLGISFVTLNLEKEYKRDVVDYMIREYKAGRTPNPDVFCNKHIKFGAFYKWAMKRGADYVATGHYARVVKHGTWNLEHKKSSDIGCYLLASIDKDKDQSYFLWQIKKEQLPHILFPVGGMKKTEVRKHASTFGLITAKKKDSQGLCFLGKVDMVDFLSHYMKKKSGDVLDEEGNIIGGHDGASFLTIGQRHGFKITKARDIGRAHYVISKNMQKNTITVSSSLQNVASTTNKQIVILAEVNWLGAEKIHTNHEYNARVRYRQKLQACRIELFDTKIRATFQSSISTAPGQSLVVYDGERLCGGGVIQ